MRRLSLAALLFLAGTLHAQTLGPVDWIFLVDTSKSMRGVGGTQNVWPDVKACLDAFVREAGTDDTVAIFAFDRDVREIQAVSHADLHRAIDALEAEGNRTHLGAAIAKGLGRATSLRARADPTRTRAVVLFTDGREDVRGIENPTAIMANVDHVGDTFVFFVSVGEHELQLDAFKEATERTEVLKPTPEAIRSMAREIRVKISKPEPPPPPPPPPPSPPIQHSEPQTSPLPWLIAVVALLALTAFLLLRHRRKQNHLEGGLEILRPRAAPDAAFVGLPQLQTSEVALSAILPVDFLAGSDARLFVRRKAGRKKVWIAVQGGSLRVNDVETPMSELYDADTIEIGDAKLRFNRVGDERPLESNEEAAL